jgi:hypothetical protein
MKIIGFLIVVFAAVFLGYIIGFSAEGSLFGATVGGGVYILLSQRSA